MSNADPGEDRAGHFDRTAEVYARARPPYPEALYARLADLGVLAPGCRLLEIGAGTGQATTRLAGAGALVTAVEPGAALAARLSTAVPDADVVIDSFERAVATGRLGIGGYDAVCVATAFHWLDPATALSSIHRLLVPGGLLAVWRHVFGDESVPTAFRDRVAAIVARRPDSPVERRHHAAQLDWVDALSGNGLFEPVDTEEYRWSIDLTAAQVHDLFGTFSDWRPDEVDDAAQAARDLGGTVTEHYRTILAVVRAGR